MGNKVTIQEIRTIVDTFFAGRFVINYEDAYKLGKIIVEKEVELCQPVITKFPNY